MWAREWFENARNVVVHREYMRERVERMRASVEGGAVRYDGVPGGGTGDGMLSIIAAEAVFAEEDAYTRSILDEATDLLFGDDGASRALGESPAYAVQLHYLEALPYSAAAVRLECTRGWAQHLAAKCLAWLDAHREPPARANRSL
jgi:hypothetical protein